MNERIKDWMTNGWVWIIIIVLATSSMVALTVWQWHWLCCAAPNGVTDSDTASNSEILRNVGFLIGGVLALLFALWRALVATRQADAAQGQTATARQNLLNERYQRGAEMLGNPVLSVRLGGTYALRRLAEEHPDQYHLQIMRLFCAFVRNPPGEDEVPFDLRELPPDVQAAITAIGERSPDGQLLESKTDFRLDLRSARLRNVDMRWLNFAGAYLRYAYLAQSDLFETNLSHANLVTANLSDAILARANLSDAILAQADLPGADLGGANLSGADLRGANLRGADLRGANLSGAILEDVNFSDAILVDANLSGARLTGANLSGADLEEAIVSGTIWGFGPRRTATGEIIRPGKYAYVSQLQLIQTVADPNNPPIIPDGATDPETGEPLVWLSGSANPQS